MAVKSAAKAAIDVPALQLQDSPPVFVIVISGRWLLNHTTPSWRLKDPQLGFQRIVKEDRARQIARTILDQRARISERDHTGNGHPRDFKKTVTTASRFRTIPSFWSLMASTACGPRSFQ